MDIRHAVGVKENIDEETAVVIPGVTWTTRVKPATAGDPSPARSVAARPPANRLRAFPGDERHHEQPRRRISPPPAEPCVETETGQKDRGQIRTDSRLTRLRLQCTAPETARDPAFEMDEERHHDQ